MITVLKMLLLLMLASLALAIFGLYSRNPLSELALQAGNGKRSGVYNLSWLWKIGPISPLTGETAMLIAGVGGFISFLLGYLASSVPVGLALAALFFLIGPRLINTWLLGRRIQRFRSSFEFGLEIMLSALGVGMPVRDALLEAALHSPEPVRTEFRQTADEISIGAREEDAFQSLARRIPCTETEELSDAIGLYKNVGGAKALDMIRAVLINLREGANAAYQVSQHVKGAKFAAVMITVIPVGYFICMLLFAPDLFGPLLSTSMGKAILTFALIIFGLGVFLISRILAGIEQF
jgi:Flp pilus assembly protein TadB